MSYCIFRKLLVLFMACGLFLLFSCDDLIPKTHKIKTKNGFKEYTVTENGDSILINYDKSKVKLSQFTFKNGYYNGKAYTYYPNGKVQYEINYKDGYKDGVIKWFFETGILYRETLYDNGDRNGIQKKYYKSGKLLAEIPYKDDKVQPGLVEYNEDGSIDKTTPVVVVREIDKTVFEDKVILEFSLKPKGYKVSYSLIKMGMQDEYELSLKKQTKKKKAYLEYTVLPGNVRIEEVKVKVSCKTKKGNPLVLYKTYKLVAENRM